MLLMPCVLIVEDDGDVREFMELLLQTSGYETMTASNGREALDRMHEKRPCLVLLDLMMPVMNGYQFREQQLADDDLADVPVVCVTAMFNPSEVVDRLHVKCLAKPIEFDTLLTEVASACRRC